MKTSLSRWLWTAAVVMSVCAGVHAAKSRPAPPPPDSASEWRADLEALEAVWRPVLGKEGASMADRVITEMTPPCAEFESVAGLAKRIRQLRTTMLAELGLDLDHRIFSSRVQRTFSHEGYSIEVIRLETFPGVFLPINVYRPQTRESRRTPLVITPTGCGSANGSEHVQRRAANLALLGMTVVVTEGFCRNGARAAPTEEDAPSPHTGYGRQLLGLAGEPFGVYLQELIATISWAVETYDSVDPAAIGVAGYSYGGQVSLYLAQIDRRVRSIAVPATYLGDACQGLRLNPDIWIEATEKDFVWSAPPELPLLPINSRLVMVYPRPLHTVSGRADRGAPPATVGAAIAYARRLYALGGHAEKIDFQEDGGGHHYGKVRRETTYGWLTHTLLGLPLAPVEERGVRLRSEAELAVDVSGGRSMEGELAAAVARERGRRFDQGRPADGVQGRMAAALSELFLSFTPQPLVGEQVWRAGPPKIRVEARVFRGPFYSFPVFVFRRDDAAGRPRLLYLPRVGTREELGKILILLARYGEVTSVDYLGIGELRSDRLLLHTIARYFMHNDPSLTKINVELLRSYLVAADPSALELHAQGWASSMLALLVASLEPERFGDLHLAGVPGQELDYLASGKKIPDLLLWGGLFSRVTAAELGAAAASDHRVHWIRPSRDPDP